MRYTWLSVAGAVVMAALSSGGKALAEPASSAQAGTAQPRTISDVSAQSRERPHRRPRRVRIYTPREPGPDSVRVCHSYYEYEYRLSGTVIVPRQNCYWSG